MVWWRSGFVELMELSFDFGDMVYVEIFEKANLDFFG